MLSARSLLFILHCRFIFCKMQVILEVAPESLYNEMFTKLFKNSLFELSSNDCGNFVVQALIPHARTKDQVCIPAFLISTMNGSL